MVLRLRPENCAPRNLKSRLIATFTQRLSEPT